MSEFTEKMSQLGSNKKPYKDGQVIRGRWAGKVVTVRKQHYDAIEAWQKASGMKKAEFWRQAVLRGALDLARNLGLADTLPKIDE